MKLSISNIGWDAKQDDVVYGLMKNRGYFGLEIAPTRIFPESPYERVHEAAKWSRDIRSTHGFAVPSMQSIWFGRQEKLFGSRKERQILIEYTKQAIDFAAAVGCKNLVFGCPRNRFLPDGADPCVGIDFFRELGNYAIAHETVIGLEANPPIYNTNYMNDTASALELVRQVDSAGFLLNLDVGTMVQNNEKALELKGNVHLVHHVHVSEPKLAPIKERTLHTELREILENEKYEGYVSLEMGKTENLNVLDDKMKYVRSVFQ